MMCPRCGNEWDVSKSPCSRCGLMVRLPDHSGATARSQPSLPPPQETAQANSSQNEGMYISSPTKKAGPADPFSAKGVPSRPQNGTFPGRSGDSSGNEAARSGAPLRPSRLMSDSVAGMRLDAPLINQNPLQELVSGARQDSAQLDFSASPLLGGSQPGVPQLNGAQIDSAVVQKDQRVLAAGTLLRSGRYRLRELRSRQDWLAGAYEAMWIAQDAQRAGSQVMICELAIPDSGSMMVQSLLRTATMALTSVGRHPHIPTLWDAFSDQGQNFFVFEPIEGETLLARMRRMGQALPEQDVIECCLQMAEILDLLAQQSPPLVHGLIRPEHILVNLTGSQYVLTNFSIILAGGATQFIAGLDRTENTPFIAPEFVRGVVDVRSDLYSLLATAYYAVTGSVPTSAGSGAPVVPAQRLNPRVSSEFEAILARGLRPIANQRYQRPSELRHDLLGMRSVSGSLVQRSASLASSQPGALPPLMPPAFSSSVAVSNQKIPDSVAQVLPNLLATGLEDNAESGLLLPRPEDLSPMEQGNDTRQATFWVIGILICLIAIVILSRSVI